MAGLAIRAITTGGSLAKLGVLLSGGSGKLGFVVEQLLQERRVGGGQDLDR